MNLDGIKFTIIFENEYDKDSFCKFIDNLDIVKTNNKFNDKEIPKNKENLKYYTYRLKHKSYKLIKNTFFEPYNFCNIDIRNLGPTILSIKETSNKYITLNFRNISYEIKFNDKSLSQEEIEFLKKYYTDTELLAKKRFLILSKVLEYIFSNNLQFNTKIKEVNFVHYDFSKDIYKFFDLNKKRFIYSDCTLDIKKYYFDYLVIYNNDEREYLTTHFQLDIAFNSEQNLSINQYITNDRIRFCTTDKNKKSIKIKEKDFFFKPLIDKESSYIKIDKFLDSKINFTNKRLEQKTVFTKEPFQLIKIKISGWFTRNNKILESKNESTKYYYRLSDSTKEINTHINQFLKKYAIYKIQNNQMEEELEEIKKLSPIKLINRDIKLNKTIMKKFEKNATVEKIDFSTSLKNLNFILDKYKK